MNFVLFDNIYRNQLLPLTFMRPMADIRVGILTIREKWEKYLKQQVSVFTETYLSKKFPLIRENDNIIIAANICPTEELVQEICSLQPGEALLKEDLLMAIHLSERELTMLENSAEYSDQFIETYFETDLEFNVVKNVYDIFLLNDKEIRADYELLTKNRISAPLNSSNQVFGNDLFIEEGAIVNGATLNTVTGPVYIGKNAEIMEGALVRGPLALGEGAVLKMGAKVYGATTVGPYSKVGGEVSNVVFFGNSNKAHDGFLGNSVIAEWCNFGADSNCSNLKNNYDKIRLWNYNSKRFESTGLQFCGLIMGDHSKCGINTMFNTGTVVGVSANIFGTGFPRNFIPSFFWGSPALHQDYELSAACETAKIVMQRRGVEFTPADAEIFKTIFENTKVNRRI